MVITGLESYGTEELTLTRCPVSFIDEELVP